MNYIFIDSKDYEERVGIVEEGRLVEYYIDKKKTKNVLAMYIGGEG